MNAVLIDLEGREMSTGRVPPPPIWYLTDKSERGYRSRETRTVFRKPLKLLLSWRPGHRAPPATHLHQTLPTARSPQERWKMGRNPLSS